MKIVKQGGQKRKDRPQGVYEKTGGQAVEITEEDTGKSKISEGIPMTIGKWQFADEDGTKIGEIVVKATFLTQKPEEI